MFPVFVLNNNLNLLKKTLHKTIYRKMAFPSLTQENKDDLEKWYGKTNR